LALFDILQDKAKLTKLVWLAYISSLAIMGIGLFIILKDLFG
jgi:hypothetical protein